MRIHLYCTCWNEIRMLPHFLRHYEQFVERMFIYDNMSTDGSRELIASHPQCELRDLDYETSEDDITRVKRYHWTDDRSPDWIVCVDIDELIHHPNWGELLPECKSAGCSILAPDGWQVVSDVFPEFPEPVFTAESRGVKDMRYSKWVMFDPKAIDDIGYNHGCHNAVPTGRVCTYQSPDLRLLHCRYLSADWVVARHKLLGSRLNEINLRNGWGAHYLVEESALRAEFAAMLQNSVPIFG